MNLEWAAIDFAFFLSNLVMWNRYRMAINLFVAGWCAASVLWQVTA